MKNIVIKDESVEVGEEEMETEEQLALRMILDAQNSYIIKDLQNENIKREETEDPDVICEVEESCNSNEMLNLEHVNELKNLNKQTVNLLGDTGDNTYSNAGMLKEKTCAESFGQKSVKTANDLDGSNLLKEKENNEEKDAVNRRRVIFDTYSEKESFSNCRKRTFDGKRVVLDSDSEESESPSKYRKRLRKQKELKCCKCKFSTIWKHELESHMLGHSSQPIECFACKYETKLKDKLQSHVIKHFKRLIKCKGLNCAFETNKYRIFAHHFKRKCRNVFFECADCKFETVFEAKLCGHKCNERSKSRKYKCYFCKRCLISRDKYRCHLHNHLKNIKNFTLFICKTRNKRLEKFKVIFQVQNSVGLWFKCHKCSFQTKYKNSLKAHVLQHSKFQTYENRNNNIQNLKAHALKKNNLYVKHKSFEIPLQRNSSSSSSSKCYYKSSLNEYSGIQILEHDKCNFKCSNCNFRGVDENNLEEHLLLHYQGNGIECSECLYVVREDDLKEHMKLHFYQCNKCDFKSKTSNGKNGKHTCMKICPSCDFKFKNLKSLRLHKISKHPELFKYKCTMCSYKYNDSKYLNDHMKAHHELYMCSYCDYEINMKNQFKYHLLKHERTKLKCGLCDYKTVYGRDLKCHMNVHCLDRKLSCPKCDYKCSTSTKLKKHISRHTGVFRFNCAQCVFKTKVKSHFENHKLTHSEEKTFSCSHCDYSAKTNISLQSHLRLHRDKKLYKCDQCEYETNYKHNLKAHVLKHTNVRLFNCDHCDFTSNYKYCIERHIQLTHNREAEEILESNDVEKLGDKENMIATSNQKQHKCPICDYSTSYFGNLRVHKQTSHLNTLYHQKENGKEKAQLSQPSSSSQKKYQCDDCQFVSFSKVGLNQHKKTHLKVKELKCSKCQYATNFKGNLTKHIKLKHNKEGNSNE